MSRRLRRAWRTSLAASACLLLAACGASAAGSSQDQSGGRELTVLAASSLTEVFTELGSRFEEGHPGVRVRFAFDSSATLAQQAAQGAPADVLATADEATMRSAEKAGAVQGSAETFALNELVLVTPRDNPADVTSLADLDRRRGDIEPAYVICVETAPCGDLAARALTQAGIQREPASLEIDVKAVLAKVVDDEADAGIVYATDAVAAGDAVRSFSIDGSDALRTSYLAAALEPSSRPDLARDWLTLLDSDVGRRALRTAGFGIP